MGKVALDKSVSLDGYDTGPNPVPERPLGDGDDRIFGWMMAASDETDWPRTCLLSDAWDHLFGDTFARTGAVIMGKRMFEMIDSPNGWVAPDGTPFTWPCSLTHKAQEPVTKGQTPFTFVSDGIESALAHARSTAGDKDIGLAGANVG